MAPTPRRGARIVPGVGSAHLSVAPVQQASVHLLLDLEETAVPLCRLVVGLQSVEALVEAGPPGLWGGAAARGRDLSVGGGAVQGRADPAPSE